MRLIYIILGLLVGSPLYAQSNYEYCPLDRGNGIILIDIKTPKPEAWTSLCDIEHPGIRRYLTPEVKDSLLKEINLINASYPKDTLLSSDIFYIFKPFFEWLRYVDPHYRVNLANTTASSLYKNEKQLRRIIKKHVRNLPFNISNINDTLIINESIDTLFKRGDIIQSINGIEAAELVKYNYADRLTTPNALLHNYFYRSFDNHFEVVVNRNKITRKIETKGEKTYRSVYIELSQKAATENNSRIIDGIGYIPVPSFFEVNSRLIKIIDKTIRSFRDKGVDKVILDLRNNPGGHGDRFDELLSLFINKESIPYLRGAKAMSEYEPITEIPLMQNKYISGIEYYVIMNEGTGSVAASFCNIMQYNGAAELLGEPLLHNALTYGETRHVQNRYPNQSIPALFRETSVSSVEFDEYSKAKNGILYPDYTITCSAKSYNKGGDPVLESALEYVKRK